MQVEDNNEYRSGGIVTAKQCIKNKEKKRANARNMDNRNGPGPKSESPKRHPMRRF